MSSSLHGYCINVSDLQALVQNPPAELIPELRQRFPKQIDAGDPQWGPSAGDALIAYLSGKPILPDPEGRLAQALELICQLRGTPIEATFFEDASAVYIY